MKLRTRMARATVAGLLGAIVITGCAERSEDTIIVGLSADITTFEPGMISSRDNANIVRHIFGSLFTLTAEGEHVPELAHTLEISDDGTAYVYGEFSSFGPLCQACEDLGVEVTKATLQRIPSQPVDFTEAQLEEIEVFIDRLEDDEDVQSVFTNIA